MPCFLATALEPTGQADPKLLPVSQIFVCVIHHSHVSMRHDENPILGGQINCFSF
jgi:hypothetical protein